MAGWKAMVALGLIFGLVRTSARDIIMDPSGTLYRAIGDEFEMVCTYKGDTTDNSSQNLVIEHRKGRNSFILTSQPVNSSSIRILIPSVQSADSGTYVCSFPPDSESISFLQVGYRPSPPKDIYCFSSDHLDMNCTVTLSDRDAQSRLGYNVTVDFQTDGSTEWQQCPQYDVQYRSCYWKSPAYSDSIGLDFLRTFSLLDSYRIRVRVRNILGTNQVVRTIDNTSTIVKISKLCKFEVSNITSRAASLSWKLPDDLLPRTFVIDFVINYSSRWKAIPEAILYSNKFIMATELRGLVPYTRYNVTIRARSQMVTDDRKWSPTESLSFTTNKDAPSAAPRYTVGGYFLPGRFLNSTGEGCALQIYTKPLSTRRQNGPLSDLYYTVSTSGETKQQLISRPLTTLSLNENDCWGTGPYTVVIQACMEGIACSQKQTDIHIPPLNQVYELPYATEVIAEGFGDTTVKVSWMMEEEFKPHITGVTVFWCRGNTELHICKSDLSWEELSGVVTETWVNLTQSSYRDWMFAVSFITHNGDSGGMVFEDCQFRYIDIDLEETSQRNLDTPFESVKPTFNLLRREDGTKQIDIVSLTFRYCDVQFLYRKPEVYEVFYKVTTRETADGCSDGAESLNVTATSRVQEIVLPDLDPNSLYSVCMRIHTSVGNSELSDVRWRKPLASLDADEVMPIILVVLVALICVAVLLVVIWCIRHNYKAIDVRVQLPTVDKYSAGDQSEAESQSLIPCSDSGIEEKRNDTIIISRNNSIVKTRRPLPAPPIAPTSTRASTDSGVIPNSLASLTVDKKLTDGEVVELSPFCKHDVSDSTDKCQVMNTDETCRSQMEYRESSRDSSGELRSYPTNGAASPGDYCQWDIMAFSSNDSSKPHNLSGEGFPMPPGGYEISTNGENIPVSIVESKSTTGESVSVQSAEHTISATGERMLVFPEEHRHSASRKLNNVPTGEYSIGTNMESIPVPNGECGICTTGESSMESIEDYVIGTTQESSPTPTAGNSVLSGNYMTNTIANALPKGGNGISTTVNGIPIPNGEYTITKTENGIPILNGEYTITTTENGFPPQTEENVSCTTGIRNPVVIGENVVSKPDVNLTTFYISTEDDPRCKTNCFQKQPENT